MVIIILFKLFEKIGYCKEGDGLKVILGNKESVENEVMLFVVEIIEFLFDSYILLFFLYKCVEDLLSVRCCVRCCMFCS